MRVPLPNIADAKSVTAADQRLFDELAGVLKRYDALHRFGITLLHQHFAIAPDEILVEHTVVDARRQLVAPVKKSDLEGVAAIETSWRLDTMQAMQICPSHDDVWTDDAYNDGPVYQEEGGSGGNSGDDSDGDSGDNSGEDSDSGGSGD